MTTGKTYTDLELAKMEQAIYHTYTKAQKELQAKWDAYMNKVKPKVDKAWNEFMQMSFHGTPEEAAKAKEAYEKAALNMTLQDKHYQEMVSQVTEKLAETNQIALDYINNQMPKVYCHSYNEFANEKIKGYSFELVNEDAVAYLVKSGNTNLLPQKQLNVEKDKAWNTKQINSGVLQGILQGESIPKIAGRLMQVTDMNQKSAIRNARTMTTGAENKGRQDSFERATNDGVEMERIWVAATGDGRTRDWHIELNGQKRAVDEPFENSVGQIMYPCDPDADPSNVYNCRCAIRAHVKGFHFKEPEYKSAYADQYKDVGVTAQYYSMLDEDKALGNEFWKALKAEGKPSQVWKNYIAGSTSKELTKQLDDIMAKYKGTGKPVKPGAAKKLASVEPKIEPKPDLGMYQDKSMTATFYSVKAENKDLGKEFWDILQSADKPSDTWKQYLIGTAPKEITEKLDKILLQHKGEGAWTKPVSAKKLVFKETFEDLDDINDIVDFNIWNEVHKAATHEGINIDDFWKAYKAGKIKNTDLDKIFKEEVAKTTKKAATKAAVKETIEESEDLVKAKSQLAVAEGNLNSIPNKTYTGIWKDPVSLSDYEAKAGSIAAKKQWYYDEIENLTHKVDAGDIAESAANAKIIKYEKYIDDLTEFETDGKLYTQYAKDYQKAFDEVKKLTPVSETFGPDAYSMARKNAALWAKNNAEYKTLDKYYDIEAKKVHGAKTTAEHEGYYHYTWGSGPFNQPLAGFDGSWSESNFKGPGKVDIDKNGYGNKIRGLTSLCEKSKYDKDFWVQSGQDTDTLAGFLELPRGIFRGMSDAELQQFVGIEKEIPQFISGAINKGGGSYTPGDMLFNIYCPAGSEALYVRSDGHFGKNEHEMILQRGGTYKITKIYWGTDKVHGGRKLIVDLELHPERGYDKFQQKK